MIELQYLRGGFWHGSRVGSGTGETVSAGQRLQRHAERFRSLSASAASDLGRKYQLQLLLQQQWARRAGPGKPATSVTVGHVVHQERQQAQCYKRLLLGKVQHAQEVAI
jgi:hypothetical protein